MSEVVSNAEPCPANQFKTTLDISTIQNFLLFLAGKAQEHEVFTFCFLDSESNNVIPKYGVVHATCDEILQMCQDFVAANINFTLHVCLNRTNLKGRKTENIISSRVLCCDLDKETGREEIKATLDQLKPGMIVESSPGRYHLYWRCEALLPVWQDYQLALAAKLGGDLNLSQLSHIIRVPGILRLRGSTECMPRIMYLELEPQEITSFEAMVPDYVQLVKQAKAQKKAEQRKIRALLVGSQKGQEHRAKTSCPLGRNSSYSIILGNGFLKEIQNRPLKRF